MYWLFITLFFVAVMIPDIIRGGLYSVPERRVEELAIFFLGVIGFLIYLRNEKKLADQVKRKEEYKEKLQQSIKDLTDSYGYIGEVNRKMDILMNVALGFSEKKIIGREKEIEAYDSIVKAANFIMRSEFTNLYFINIGTKEIKKQYGTQSSRLRTRIETVLAVEESSDFIQEKDIMIVSSKNSVRGIRSHLVIHGYGKDREKDPNNIEILKVLTSQALFLYAYLVRGNNN